MNRKLVFFIIFIIVICAGLTYVFAAESTKFTSAFIKNFRNCHNFEETTQYTSEGQTFKTIRKINGWVDGACQYSETIYSQNEAYNLDCYFPEIQVEEIYDSMKNKSKEQEEFLLNVYGKKKDPRTGKESFAVINQINITGTKAEITWAKYENDPYVCTPQKIK